MTKRKGKNRKRAARRAQDRHQQRLKSREDASTQTTTGELLPAETGLGAKFLSDPHHVRRDAKTIAQMFGMGVIEDEQANSVIKHMHILLLRSQKAREVASLTNAMTKMIQVHHETQQPKVPTLHLHNHEHQADRSRLSAIAASLGAEPLPEPR